MKNLGLLLALTISTASLSAPKDTTIGEEVITPSEYPKFSLFGKYNSSRHGSIRGQDFAANLSTFFGGGAYVDIGLYDHLSAGAMLNLDVNLGTNESESVVTRFSIFARPKISFFDCLTIFSRIGFGPTVFMGYPHEAVYQKASDEVKNRMDPTYNIKNNPNLLKYSPVSPGVHGMATFGLEYFPISRVGLSLEVGVLADYLFVSQSKIIGDYVDKNLTKSGQSVEPYTYLNFEIPVMLSLNIIL